MVESEGKPGDRFHLDGRGNVAKPELTSDNLAFLSVCPGSM